MSLFNILNPEPSRDEALDESHPDARKSSLSSSSSHTVPPSHSPEFQSPNAHNVAHSHGASPDFSTFSAHPPTSWDDFTNGAMNAPTTAFAGQRRMSSIELPHPPATARKMSSPTLDQYHVSSRSPEQQRRQSILPSADESLTLAPIKSHDSVSEAPQHTATPAAEEKHPNPVAVGHDSSQVVQAHTIDAQNTDAKTSVQLLADHREPAYTREEPTTSQIRRPSVSSQTAPERRTSVASLSLDAKAPIAGLKQEHSSHAHSPLRESSVPVPSTEMPTTSTIPRKRPPPKSAGKKGTASTVKKEPASKKRKTESGAVAAKRAGTPSSSQKVKGNLAATKRLASTSATSANSSPAPHSVRTVSPRSSPSVEVDADAESQDEEDDEDQGSPDPDADRYCLCKRPDTGTFMIGCDGECNDWFHGKCVGIAEKDKGLIDKYICPSCEKQGELFTTWKRMCRRVGCRMPAKGAGDTTKKGKTMEKSKYCSDECGVRYFQELVSKTRGAPDASSYTAKPKKHRGSVSGSEATKALDEDLGPRGGILSASELKTLISSAPGVDEFRRLGDGVLSPPLTPSPKATRDSPDAHKPGLILTEAEHERVNDIAKKKDITRTRHGLLRDRQKFVPMVKQAATDLAEQKKMKPKDMCGYDSRIAWTEEQFETWRSSAEGAAALKKGELNRAAVVDAEGDTSMTNGVGAGDGLETCIKRKCARHHEWAKLALDDLRMEVTENSEAMRVLEREEIEIKERAGLRAREMSARGAGGSVELHGVAKATTVPEPAVTAEEHKDEVVADASAPTAEEQEPENQEQHQTLATPAVEVAAATGDALP